MKNNEPCKTINPGKQTTTENEQPQKNNHEKRTTMKNIRKNNHGKTNRTKWSIIMAVLIRRRRWGRAGQVATLARCCDSYYSFVCSLYFSYFSFLWNFPIFLHCFFFNFSMLNIYFVFAS